MAKEKNILELRDVGKTYQMGETSLNVLKHININVEENDFISIQGPSGSGKSTLMYLVGCLDIPDKGKILLNGHDISKLSENQLARIRGEEIGFVFQAFNLVPILSAVENVILPTLFQEKRPPEKEIMKRALELLKMVGLEKRSHHRPTQMSGGEQQRVAIARALINNPRIILADEPTGNLDSKTGHEVMKMLAELHLKQKKTIIVVTHDPSIAKYAHKQINIIDGQIAHDHQLSRRYLWSKDS